MATLPGLSERAVAIDPMSTILSGKAYAIWIEKKHPHVPKTAELKEAYAQLSPEDRGAVLARAETLIEYGTAVRGVIESLR